MTTLPIVVLWILMWAVTYPSRAIPLLTPGLDRLPPRALLYLRLVGPAVLASLAATAVFVREGADGTTAFTVGPEILAVLLCMAIVWWRKNLLLGILAAVVFVAVVRAIGLG
jgi:branched-subunit amino acid transport protein